MINKEVVVFQIEDMLSNINKENLLTYGGHIENGTAFLELMTNVLALLKEQEPILLENQHKPYGISTNANSPWISRCPRCGRKVEGKQTKFCKYCGQAVKWNDK